jgi:hypothetical protein
MSQLVQYFKQNKWSLFLVIRARDKSVGILGVEEAAKDKKNLHRSLRKP